MADFRISVGLDGIAAIRAEIYQQVFPLLTAAVNAVAQQARIDWMEGVQRAKLWSEEKDAYAASIQWKPTGPYSAVVWSDYRYAEDIETGRPERDLKKMLDTSLKVRVSKQGKRYLIIPFRHSTPGRNAVGQSMPQHVYAVARKLKPSSVTGQTTRLSGTGAMDVKTRQHLTVPQNLYSWGGRLPPGMMGPNPKGKSDRYAGMVRFNNATPGGKQYSSYLTFRVLSENSKGWIIPPKPGLFIAKKVADDLQPKAQQVFEAAIARSF